MHAAGKRYPAICELRLEGKGNRMVPSNVFVWDFSNLPVLILLRINLKSFFKDVPFEKLAGLREFKIKQGWAMGCRGDKWVDEYLVSCMEAIARLEMLDNRCAHPHRLLPALEKHRMSLQVLKLAQCRTHLPAQATLEEIEKLRTLCQYLNELVLDVKVATDAEIEHQK